MTITNLDLSCVSLWYSLSFHIRWHAILSYFNTWNLYGSLLVGIFSLIRGPELNFGLFCFIPIVSRSYNSSLNIIGPHKFIGNNGTVERCGFFEYFVGGSVSSWRQSLRSHMLKPWPVSQTTSCCLWVKSTQLLFQHYVCLHTALLPFMRIMDWTSEL